MVSESSASYIVKYLKKKEEDICGQEDITTVEMRPIGSSNDNGGVRQSTKLKVRTEKSAVVFALVVILFLLTHSFRMALKVYEVALPNSFSIDRFKMCFSLKR